MHKGKAVVPNRLLTKEMITWQRAYKDTRKIAQASQMAGPILDDRGVLQQALFQMKNLLERVPRTKIKELAQQPDVDAPGEEQE